LATLAIAFLSIASVLESVLLLDSNAGLVETWSIALETFTAR